MTFALEFTRLSGRDVEPRFSHIPADESPADEIAAFMHVMKLIRAKVTEITAGLEWVVNLTETKQVYKVRLVEVEPPVAYDDTQELIIGANDFGTEVYSK